MRIPGSALLGAVVWVCFVKTLLYFRYLWSEAEEGRQLENLLLTVGKSTWRASVPDSDRCSGELSISTCLTLTWI